MTTQIRSELLKLTTVPTSTIFAAATAAFVGLLVATQAMTAGSEFSGPLTDATTQEAMFVSGGPAALIAIVFGCLSLTSELRHDTIVPTLLFDPSRPSMVVAKAVATLLAGAALGVIGILVAVGATGAILAATGTAVVADLGQVGLVAAGTVGGAAIGAVFGLGVGGIVRNQALAVGVVLIVLLVIEPLVGSFLPEVAPWLPAGLATGHATGMSEGRAVAVSALWLSAAAFAGYALVTTAGATWRLRRADIT